MGFLRHFTPELLSIKKSATFAHSTFRIIIPSVGFIPSLVAPQQSQCPFIPTNKSTENFYDTVRFTLPLQELIIEKMKTENYHKFIYGNIVPMKKRVGVLCECKRTHIKNL